MCEKTISKTTYECGDEETRDFTFTSDDDQSKPGHTAKVNPLGSKRVKGRCGKANCKNPWAGYVSSS